MTEEVGLEEMVESGSVAVDEESLVMTVDEQGEVLGKAGQQLVVLHLVLIGLYHGFQRIILVSVHPEQLLDYIRGGQNYCLQKKTLPFWSEPPSFAGSPSRV
jgi:hypothetical protein